MKYPIVIIAIIIFGLGGCSNENLPKRIRHEPVIVKRIDGIYGKKFYGVKIYPIQEGNVYRVMCEIQIGQGKPYYYHNIGEIGKANSLQEITERFSSIEMKKYPDGEWLVIGNQKVISRKKLETHR